MASKTIIFILCFVYYINIVFAEEQHCNDHNEIYTCGGACQTTCKTLNQTCAIINVACNNRCYCKEGYVRVSDSNDRCIPYQRCKPDKPRPSENPHNCEGWNKPDLESIPPINCTGEHEEYQCGSACQTECATLGQPCPIVNITCNNGCYCKKGFARNISGKCIPIKNCPGQLNKRYTIGI